MRSYALCGLVRFMRYVCACCGGRVVVKVVFSASFASVFVVRYESNHYIYTFNVCVCVCCGCVVFVGVMCCVCSCCPWLFGLFHV